MATAQITPPPREKPAATGGATLDPRSSARTLERPPRLVSLDAYRGFIMLVMASGGLAFAQFATRLDGAVLGGTTAGLLAAPTSGPLNAASALVPGRSDDLPPSRLWAFLGYQFEHVPWIGCSFWDLIQPSFMFMVGVALPYSFASRRARGDSYGKMLAHAGWRALILILLAVFLSSPATLPRGTPRPEGPLTNWVFTNVLAQIGLGYVFVFLLVGRGLRLQLAVLAAILIGYTLLFGLYPLPAAGFDYHSVGLKDGWPMLTGWFAHWQKNANAAHAFDLWFLNLFPRAEPFRFNPGGYQTLNFIPSMATMILGLMAGEMLRGPRTPRAKFALLVGAAVGCLALGWVMGLTVCPIVKRIWTPSWAVFSAGWTFAILAGFFWVIDVRSWKAWALPLVVVGMNSIAMYCMSQLLKTWTRRTLEVHLGRSWFTGPYGAILMSAAVLFVLWLFCLWLYRRKIFLRI
jgi:predicted acyltransferase